MMSRLANIGLIVVAASMGLGAWFLTAALATTSEAWDSPIFLYGTYPALALAVAVMAYATPSRSWRWAVAATVGLDLGSFLDGMASGWSWNLWPFTMVGWVMMSVPLLAAARLGTWLRRKRSWEETLQ